MAIRKNRAFAKLATNVDADGDITANAIASQTLLEAGALDSATIIELIDSDYVSVRSDGVTTGKSIAMSIVFGG